MKKTLVCFISLLVLSFVFVIVSINDNVDNSYKYIYDNVNILNSYSIKTNILPIVSRSQINCPEGYRNYPVDDETYCVNQFKNLYENGINVQIKGTDDLYCLAMNLPYDDSLSFSDNCNKIGSGWVHDETDDDSQEFIMCKNEDVNSCVLNEYNISYKYDSGFSGEEAPTSAKIDEVVKISNPKKVFIINGVDRNYNANVGNATEVNLTFAGWTFNGDTTTALYGNERNNVTHNWNSYNTKVISEYFKNLAPIGGVVELIANWKLDVVEAKLPTIEKEGYQCLWYRSSDPSEDSVGYESGSTIDLTSLPLSGNSLNFYAECVENSSNVVPPQNSESEETPENNEQVTLPEIEDSNMEDMEEVDNPQTGDIAIFFVLILALASISYSIYYFRTIKQQEQ